MKRKLTVFFLTALLLLVSCFFTASAYDSELANDVTSTYSAALSLAGRRSFHGNCNLATAYQLRALGIYDGQLDFSGSGDQWYSHFSGVSKTSGGYNVITISGKNCLYDLIEKYGTPIYNVIYSLGTGGTSGTKHVLLIRAIIDGYVYFADSFGCTYGRTYYPEGTCTVLSLEKFISAYRGMNGDAHGCVYFTKQNGADHLEGSANNPDSWKNDDKDRTPGEYIITASVLRIRGGAGTEFESLGTIPNGATVYVTEISGGWGKIDYSGIQGWISLEYALSISNPDDDLSNDASAGLRATLLTADKSTVEPGGTVTWTAGAEGGSSDKYFYSFDIYLDGEIVYTRTYQTDNSITYTAGEEGTYQASVTILDSQNNKAQLYGDAVTCIDIENLLIGDVDNNGKITSADARLALRASAKIEDMDARQLICADMNRDGKITSADARMILRKSAKLD